MSHSSLRNLPSVDWLLGKLTDIELPRASVVAIVQRTLENLREEGNIPERDQLLKQLRTALTDHARRRIQPVINATGVLIHTNLGRSPLGQDVIGAISETAAQYCNLEFDLLQGHRTGRSSYLKRHLALLCSAEAATVVNNNASALMLVLQHFCSEGKNEVIVSRGELVQIGGGFRIPDILAASGAQLREVGTTNHTTLADYQGAFSEQTALVLKVHRSNFFMSGFVNSPGTGQLVELCRDHSIALIEDLGSGALLPTEKLNPALNHEPTVSEVLKQGVDLVTFSGDKVLGGPQAGIIAGKKILVDALEQEPVFRALRCDKLILVALQTVVDSYLNQQEQNSVPLIAMVTTPQPILEQRAGRIVEALSDCDLSLEVVKSEARVGGGSLPESSIPSVALRINSEFVEPDCLAARLRHGSLPLVGYIKADRLCLDLRSVLPEQDKLLIAALKSACGEEDSRPSGSTT